MWKKDRDALYYSSKNSGGKRSGGKKSYTPENKVFDSCGKGLAKDHWSSLNNRNDSPKE